MSLFPPGINMTFAARGGGGGTGITGVLSQSYSSPPGVPVSGDAYIVDDPGSGAWAGQGNNIAVWDGASWIFTAPTLGQLIYVADESKYYTWNGSAWVEQTMAAHGSTHEDGGTDPVASLPTPDEKDALVGTYGTPNSANPYVTNDDPRLTSGGGGGGCAPCLTCANSTYTDGVYHTIATIPVSDDSAMLIEVRALGRRTDSPDRAGYLRKAVVYREAGGAATIQGTVDTALTRESNTVWNVRVAVSGNNALIQVRGAAASTVNWNVCWTLTEVLGMLTTIDGVYHTILTYAMQDNTVVMFEATAVARRTSTAGRGAYLRKAIVYREGGGAATIQGTVDSPLTRESASAWDVTIGVSGSNVLVKVRGAAGQTVNWKASYVTEEIS